MNAASRFSHTALDSELLLPVRCQTRTLPNMYIDYASDTLHRYDIDDRCILLGFDSFLDRYKKWQYVCYWIILSYYTYLQSIYYITCHHITINRYLCLLIRYNLSNVVTCVGVHWSSVYDRPRMLHLVVLLISASSLLWRLVYATLRSMGVCWSHDLTSSFFIFCFALLTDVVVYLVLIKGQSSTVAIERYCWWDASCTPRVITDIVRTGSVAQSYNKKARSTEI